MIQYSLTCENGHRFDSWFQSAAAFDRLKQAGHVTCEFCGSTSVDKALMAPRVSHGTAPTDAAAQAQTQAKLTEPANEMEQAMAKLRAHVEANSDYVGQDFATQARSMYLGEVESRPIWGEAKGEDAKALIEDGVPVAPLPFTPSRKSN